MDKNGKNGEELPPKAVRPGITDKTGAARPPAANSNIRPTA